MPTLITCDFCEGTGKLHLSDKLEKTLALVPKLGTVVADVIAKKLGMEPTAINNRLANLFLLNLVTRERRGKYWLYTRSNPTPRRTRK